MPLISLGLPVYNGGDFLSECLDSLLAQTYTDFEVIISDNASSDETRSICLAYCARDSRIRYYRQAHNIGAARNFNFTFCKAAGSFFKWCASDDILMPDFLERTLSSLLQDAEAVLCHSYTEIVDRDGRHLELFIPRFSYPNRDKIARLHEVMMYGQRCYEVFGLIRVDALRKTKLIGNHKGGDNLLLLRLALLGSWAILPEPLFRLRRHEDQSTVRVRNSQAYHTWFTGDSRAFSMPDWLFIWECLQISNGIEFTPGERLRFVRAMYAYTRAHKGRLRQNIRVVVERLVFGASDPLARRRMFRRTSS